MSKKLLRSKKDRWLGGVCAGFAQFFSFSDGAGLNINPTRIRLLWMILSLFTFGTMAAIYILCWIILPSEHEQNTIT